MNRSRVTLLDVAVAAGVSRTTASVALGGSGRVSPATVDHVRAVAARLGYHGNDAARNLRRGRAGIIGLYLPVDIGTLEYYMRFVFGAAEQARVRGFALTILLAGHDLSSLPDRVDGVIAVDPLAADAGLQALIRAEFPVVCNERIPDAPDAPVPVVEPDHDQVMTTLLDHLADRGAERVAFIAAGDNTSWGRRTAAAYAGWCDRHERRALLRQTSFTASADHVADVARDLVADPRRPDAVISAPDGAAIGVLDAARSQGLVVGGDILVAAAVDSSAFRLVRPGITAVDHYPARIGAQCTDLVTDWVESGARPPAPPRLRFDLIARGSTGGAVPASVPAR
ncbi:LacI family DNA-binding transcriptional regulator [Microbacterium sp.]|uniref:LacI family DNA-binding transcriptional regulator n=1 Tax=Microbacterium sp. TaxID=51671 RepID=UPI003A850A1B